MSKGISKKEGWLKKEGKRRYFVLVDSNLTWFVQPMTKAKGTIDLKNFEISQSYASEIEASIPAPKKKLSKLGSSFNLSRVSPENEYYFKIAPKEGAISNSKTYFLVCSSVHEMKEWIQVLQEASHSNSVSTSIEKGGWLEKKGKKRWFVLRDDVLYWFSKEISPSSDFFNDVSYNGCFELGQGCNVITTPGKEFSMTLTNLNGVSYTVKAKNDQERKEWLSAISQSIIHSMEKAKKEAPTIEKEGFLTKKGKRRYFVLQKGRLTWYLSEKKDKPKGSLNIVSCIITNNFPISSKLSFTLVPSMGEKYEIFAQSAHELHQWIEALGSSKRKIMEVKSVDDNTTDIKMAGVLTKKGKKRYYTLMKDVLLWYAEIPGEGRPSLLSQFTKSGVQPRGSIKLQADCVVLTDQADPFSFSITSRGKIYKLTGSTITDVQKWVTTLKESISQNVIDQSEKLNSPYSSQSNISFPTNNTKSGWLTKKGKPRWFLILNDTLVWYDREQTMVVSTHSKGSLSLATCVVSRGDHLAKNTFVVSTDFGNSYVLTAKSQVECEEWISFLEQSISAAQERKQKSRSNYNEDKVKAGWLVKKSKQRWYLLRNNFLMWYTMENGSGLKGSLSLANCTVIPDPENKTGFILETSMHYKYKITTPSENDMKQWVGAIQGAIEQANHEIEKHYVVAEKNSSEILSIIQNDLSITSALIKVYQSDELLGAIVKLFSAKGDPYSLLIRLVTSEINNFDSESILFRTDSVATKAIRAFLRLEAMDYLKKILCPLIELIISKNEIIEVDPEKIGVSEVPQNSEKLKTTTQNFLTEILNSKNSFPLNVSIFLKNLKCAVEKNFPNSKVKVIGAFIFLRFICPAIFSPEGFDLIKSSPSNQQRRTLILIAKLIQTIASGVTFKEDHKESYMLVFNDFVAQNQASLFQFMDSISETNPNQKKVPLTISQKDEILALSLIVRHLGNSWKLMEKEFEKNPAKEWKRLKIILSSVLE